MRLLQPEMAAWFLAVPLIALCWYAHFLYKWPRGSRARALRITAISRRSTMRHDVVLLVLSILAVVLLAAAMTRPQLRFARRTPQMERQDLILILDRSVSMRARDIRPSRLGRALDEIKNFLQRKPDTIDRVALLGFASTSVPLSYPTRDLDSIFFYLDWARDDPTPMYGTNIGAALSGALAVARRDPQDGVAPLFVVISDGEDDGAELERAIATFRRDNLRVHAIGIGSYDEVPMPVTGTDGRESFLEDEAGQVLMTRFDESTLQRVAGSTGGRYFRSTTGGELQAALDAAATGERRQVGWATTTEYRDLYLLLLTGAALSSFAAVTRL
jgi:Ca-activated chloride channel family protein